jgi:hypothetical protein
MVVIFSALHLSALLLAGLLFSMFVRSGRENGRPGDDEEDGGGGGNDRVGDRPKTSPPGGLPLPDAVPPPVRLRGHERLRELRPHPARRPAEHPGPARRRAPA